MGAVRVDIAPDLLQWAVSRAGWDEMTTLRRFPKFTDWVNGKVRPTLKQLETFASSTHAPLGMLFLPEPPVEALPIPDMRTMGDTGVPAPSPDLLDTIYLCQRRQEWYREYALESGATRLDFLGSAKLETQPAEVATTIRSSLRLDERDVSSWSEAMRDLIDRVEGLGTLVMVNGIVGENTHRKLSPEEFRGFALYDDVAPLVFVNGADTKAAQIFTLTHELAHLWLGHSALSNVSLGNRSSKPEERWCNEVATEVLVPQDAFIQSFSGSTDEAETERLAREFKVSTLVILTRVFEMGHLNWDEYRLRYVAERERVTSLAQESKTTSSGGNYYNTQPLRLGPQFARAVIRSTLEGKTTYRDAYRLLGTKKHSTFEGLAETLKVA